MLALLTGAVNIINRKNVRFESLFKLYNTEGEGVLVHPRQENGQAPELPNNYTVRQGQLFHSLMCSISGPMEQ